MTTTEPMDRGALLQRLAELERENRDLRARLQDQASDRSGLPSDHASELQLRQIADHLPALIAYVDSDQRYRFNNRAYESWVGQTPESLYGVYLWDAVGAPAA